MVGLGRLVQHHKVSTDGPYRADLVVVDGDERFPPRTVRLALLLTLDGEHHGPLVARLRVEFQHANVKTVHVVAELNTHHAAE